MIKTFRYCKGFCKKCGEPLGFIKDYNFFCYSCNGYKILDESLCFSKIEKRLKELRLQFRDGIINGNAERYLYNFINLGEGILSSESFRLSPNIPKPVKTELIHWNILNLALANIAINWILEDLNYKYFDSTDYSENIFIIPHNWLTLFRKKIFLKNGLGAYIINEDDKIYFYYFQSWVFYGDSLAQFGIIDPDRIDEYYLKNFIDDMFELEKKKTLLKEFVKSNFPLTFVSSLYNIYPNREDRIFSFDDILYDDSGMIPYAIKRFYDYYDNKRARTFEEMEEINKPYFVIRTYNQLRTEIKELPWFDKVFNLLIIASQYNPISYPLLIQYQNKIIISPTRLQIASLLLHEKIQHRKIHKKLGKENEIKFQNNVETLLNKLGVLVDDPLDKISLTNIIDKKKMTFEIDILGFYNDSILVIECKSIRMAPFYNLVPYRHERKLQYLHFKDQFVQKIRPWLIGNLKKEPYNSFIQISCRKMDLSQLIINIPPKYHNLDKNKIIGVYITQLDECFKDKSDIIQIYYGDLQNYSDSLNI